MHSVCGKCGTFTWELSEEAPNLSNWKLFFVRCAMCKVPIGVLEYNNAGAKLDKVEKTVTVLGDSLTRMFQVIDANIRQLFRK